MSVTGPNYNINATALLSKQDLEKGVIGKGSWHEEYKDSCYIFVGGVPIKMTEGDLVIIFSQYGDIIDVRLIRDKDTGASKGYGFIGYENQKSTILAVDNFNGYELLGRRLRVDHCKNFYAPKTDDGKPYEPTGAEGFGLHVYGALKSVQALREPLNSSEPSGTNRLNQSKEPVKTTKILDEDEKWAQEFESKLVKKHDKKHVKKEEKLSNKKKIKLEKIKKERISSRSLERVVGKKSKTEEQ